MSEIGQEMIGLCQECKGTGKYAPLFGPPEPCRVCEGSGAEEAITTPIGGSTYYCDGAAEATIPITPGQADQADQIIQVCQQRIPLAGLWVVQKTTWMIEVPLGYERSVTFWVTQDHDKRQRPFDKVTLDLDVQLPGADTLSMPEAASCRRALIGFLGNWIACWSHVPCTAGLAENIYRQWIERALIADGWARDFWKTLQRELDRPR